MSSSAIAGLSLETVLYEKKGGIAYVTLNRPKVLNALNKTAIADLRAAFESARDDSEVHGVILTGAGDKAFIAGADINEVATDTPVQAEEKTRRGQDVMTLIENLGKPVIAAVNGFALGGGCEAALASHHPHRRGKREIRVARSETRDHSGLRRHSAACKTCREGCGLAAHPNRRNDRRTRSLPHRSGERSGPGSGTDRPRGSHPCANRR